MEEIKKEPVTALLILLNILIFLNSLEAQKMDSICWNVELVMHR